MKFSAAITLLVSAVVEAHCEHLPLFRPRGQRGIVAGLTQTHRHIPQRRELGRLAICPHDSKLPEQRAGDQRQLGGHPLLSTDSWSRRQWCSQRDSRPGTAIQRQGVYFTPWADGLLYCPGSSGRVGEDLGRQGQGVVQDLSGSAQAGRRHDVADSRFVSRPITQLSHSVANTTTQAQDPSASQSPSASRTATTCCVPNTLACILPAAQEAPSSTSRARRSRSAVAQGRTAQRTWFRSRALTRHRTLVS